MKNLLCALWLWVVLSCSLSASSMWWEAENPQDSVNARSTSHQPDDKFGRVLSEQGKLEAENQNGEPMSATYAIDVSESGKKHLWVRKFWRHGPVDWRFNEEAWQIGKRNVALHSSQFIMRNWATNWVYLGEVDLLAGRHSFQIRIQDNKGFLDCFLLTDEAFQPAGRLKPGVKSGQSDEGWFPWEPDADTFRSSPLDLRYLNEKVAGENGFVTRKGEGFLRGDGDPIRFWMVQAGIFNMQAHMQERHARRLAKNGVNLVRIAFMRDFLAFRRDPEAFSQNQLDDIHRGVASLKAQGIYLYFGHLFWDTQVKALYDNELRGLKKGESATAALFFNQELQAQYLEWIAALMTPINPYTGLSLAEDPSIAFIEVQNESNTLFWTMNPDRLAQDTLNRIQKGFGKFAAKKYGSLELAFQAWKNDLPADDLDAGTAGILGAWFMTSAGKMAHPHRSRDQVEFLTTVQYDFYAKMKMKFREMGIRSLVAGSNWKTAEPATLGPLEYYSYTAVDVVNKNEYFAPVHLHNPRTYLVEQGDKYVSLSAMKHPEIAGVLMTAQPLGHPFMITENNWDKPGEYRAEWPFLVATYGKAAGIDGWNFFAYDTPMWDTHSNVWSMNTPETIGQFPAYALMYRRGDVTEPDPIVVEDIPLSYLYDRNPISLPEVQYKDELWKGILGGDPKVEYTSKLDPRLFFAGPVRLNLNANAHSLTSVNESIYLKPDGRILHANKQLEWNTRDGVITVNTALSQGICGFIGSRDSISLTDVDFSSKNDYGTLIAISLDGKPLSSSKSILLQAGTQDQPFGFKTQRGENGESEILALGGYPIQVKEIQAWVKLKGKAGGKVTALDGNGIPDQTVKVNYRVVDGDLIVQFPKHRLYLWVQP